MQFTENFSFLRVINILTFQSLLMKYLFTILLIVLFSTSALSQSLSVAPASGHANLNQSDFSLFDGAISVSSSQITIGNETIYQPSSWSVSPEGKKIGTLEPIVNLNLIQYDYRGNKLSEKELEFFDTSDETIAIYQFDNGKVITRDNVANFTFFAPGGVTLFSVSNSSQSSGGERVSELASDPSGKTVVLYNPVISYGNNRGSRSSIIFGENERKEFFRSDREEIKTLSVSSDGSYILILTSGAGSEKAHIFDRFGNTLNEISLDEGQTGLSISKGGEYLTSYSRGRVQVYNILNGERIGSTSSRNPVLYAQYIPEDETIIALGGSYSNRLISEPMITAVHVSKRQIARQDITVSLSAISLKKVAVNRQASGRYKMKGLNKDLEITARF